MPYIQQKDRKVLDPAIANLNNTLTALDNRKGNLNYSITNLLISYLEEKGISYDTLSDLNGVLADVQQEYYRRLVVPYEESKIAQNGDIDIPKFKKAVNKSLPEIHTAMQDVGFWGNLETDSVESRAAQKMYLYLQSKL